MKIANSFCDYSESAKGAVPASRARVAPKPKAAFELTFSQSKPIKKLAGRVLMPMVKLYNRRLCLSGAAETEDSLFRIAMSHSKAILCMVKKEKISNQAWKNKFSPFSPKEFKRPILSLNPPGG
jgi:hypothetical protein